MKPTSDDFYPNYEGNQVLIEAVKSSPDGDYYIVVQGRDDFSMVKSFENITDLYNSSHVTQNKNNSEKLNNQNNQNKTYS